MLACRLIDQSIASLSNQWYQQQELEPTLALAVFHVHPGPVSVLRTEQACGRFGALRTAMVAYLCLRVPIFFSIPACLVWSISAICHLPMKRELALRRWAALAYVLLLLCHSPTLAMALCVHQSRHLRSARYALRHATMGPAAPLDKAVEAFSSVTIPPRQRGLRRARTTTMHSDAYAGSTSTSTHAQLSPLPTAMDRVLPFGFGRCVGVALPAALTDDVMRAAEEELLPEEMAYCAGLPKTLQVSGAGGNLGERHDKIEESSVVAAAAMRVFDGVQCPRVFWFDPTTTYLHATSCGVASTSLLCTYLTFEFSYFYCSISKCCTSLPTTTRGRRGLP